MSYQLTAMTTEHLPAARALWLETEGLEVTDGDSVADLTGYLARNPASSTVALDAAGRLVGAVLCGHDGRRGFVYHLAVAADDRGKGIGRAMMRRSLATLRAAGVQRVLLLVSADNESGQRFWRDGGWEDMPFARPMGLDL